MILDNLIKAIQTGELTSLPLIVALLEGEQKLIKNALDVAYANGRVDALKGDLKSPYSEWKYSENNEPNISDSQN